MTIHFAPLIKKKKVVTYLDDSFMQSQTKEEMFEIISEYHSLLRKSGLKAAPEKTFLFLKEVKFLGHLISEHGISPLHKKVEALKNLKSPENKRDVMRILGSFGFYSCYIRNLTITAKPLFDLIKGDTKFQWNPEHEVILQQIKDEMSKDTVLAVPDIKYPFHIHVDSSSVGTGCILIQEVRSADRDLLPAPRP